MGTHQNNGWNSGVVMQKILEKNVWTTNSQIKLNIIKHSAVFHYFMCHDGDDDNNNLIAADNRWNLILN